MSITDRDKKILAVLAVIGALAGYWFLLLSPKRAEVATVEAQIATQQDQRDAARAQMRAAQTAQVSFETDYAEMVRLGKAIPSSVDMPSLLVQLDRAARGTDIDFDKVTAGQRVSAAATPPAQAPAGSEGAAAPGGEQAGSAPGQAAEGAAESAQQTDTQTSETARDGSVPVGGGGDPGGAAATQGASAPPGLDTVPLDFTFTGDFFDLAAFFHRLKRFVHLDDNGIVVRGRLMTIDSFTFNTDPAGDGLTAAVKATVYLAPKAEGATAGATPSGPAPQADASTAATPTSPTAAVQP